MHFLQPIRPFPHYSQLSSNIAELIRFLSLLFIIIIVYIYIYILLCSSVVFTCEAFFRAARGGMVLLK